MAKAKQVRADLANRTIWISTVFHDSAKAREITGVSIFLIVASVRRRFLDLQKAQHHASSPGDDLRQVACDLYFRDADFNRRTRRADARRTRDLWLGALVSTRSFARIAIFCAYSKIRKLPCFCRGRCDASGLLSKNFDCLADIRGLSVCDASSGCSRQS